MAVSYKKLWKLLIDKDMKKKDLQALHAIEMSKQVIFTAPQIRSFLYSLKKGNINDDNNRRGLINIFLGEIYLKDDRFTPILNSGNRPIVMDDIEAALEEGVGCSSMVGPALPDGYCTNFRVLRFFWRTDD
ncbi:MAG: site-specific recombinase [Kosmotogales bacterium]|nr:site-specific recombinase [Kosmotogales bacterium]